MATDIIQQLWASDTNSFSVSPRLADGEWESPDADILIDQQVRASGKRNIDFAMRPLFAKVNEDKLNSLPTYVAFKGLLNNYIVNYRREETRTAEEETEIRKFVDAILPTEPMTLARKYIQETLHYPLTDEEWMASIDKLWFVPFTNYFNGVPTHFCSGFEHVFVGEGKYNVQMGAGATRGEVSGYHSWIKFYLDEQAKRVDFRGFKYDVQGSQTPSTPNVVTLQMVWNHQDLEGQVLAELFKKTGGFFVGPSPECEIATGMVLYWESQSSVFTGDRRYVEIEGDRYNLVLYRSVDPDGRRGDHIRSLYPEFIGRVGGPGQPVEPGMGHTVVLPTPLINDGPVRIAAALVNPIGDDIGNETVTLLNATDAEVDLTGWDLRDANGRSQPLTGTIPPQATRKIAVPRATVNSVQLGNNGGRIELYQDGTRIAAVSYGKAAQGAELLFQ
jgi:poly(U)-specific endoribonuclease